MWWNSKLRASFFFFFLDYILRQLAAKVCFFWTRNTNPLYPHISCATVFFLNINLLTCPKLNLYLFLYLFFLPSSPCKLMTMACSKLLWPKHLNSFLTNLTLYIHSIWKSSWLDNKKYSESDNASQSQGIESLSHHLN